MTVAFSDERGDPSLPEPIVTQELIDLAGIVMEAESLPTATEVAFLLVDEEPMTELNERHMGRSGPTDVLAFPLESLAPGRPPAPPIGGPPLLIGDVFICPDVVARNAALAGVPFADEMALMVVHGLLHLLGYDHVVESEAEQMEQRERDLLAVTGRVRP